MSIKIHQEKKRFSNLSPLGKLTQVALWGYANKWFHVREKFNKEKVTFLSKSQEFYQDIQQIRKDFAIPRLKPDEDYRTIPVWDGEIEDSDWLHCKSNDFIDDFESRIKHILIKYGLSSAFTDWVEWQVLYDQKPKSYPHFYFELIYLLKNNPEEIERIGLTSAEKQMAKSLFADMVGIKRRPTKQKQEQYKTVKQQLDAILVSSKNKQRPMKNVQRALKTLTAGRVREEKDEYEDIIIKRKITYADIAQEVYSFKEEKKLGPVKVAQNLRKQKQRLLKRAPYLTKKLKK